MLIFCLISWTSPGFPIYIPFILEDYQALYLFPIYNIAQSQFHKGMAFISSVPTMAAVVTPTPKTLAHCSSLIRRNSSTGFIISSSLAKAFSIPKPIYFSCINKFHEVIDIFLCIKVSKNIKVEVYKDKPIDMPNKNILNHKINKNDKI